MKGTCQLLCFVICSSAFAKDAELSAAGDREHFISILEKSFRVWDDDADGVLSAGEINGLVEREDIQGEAAAAVAALKRAARLSKIKLPSFTLAHLKELAMNKLQTGWPDLPAMFAGSLKRIRTASRTLFSEAGPRLETIHQGRMGNCFSLAPLGAMASLRPAYISSQMIRELPDGRYEVRLGGTKVVVTRPTDAEVAMGAGNEEGGLWVNVYEKAAGVAHNEKKPADKRDATGLDALNRGGSAGTQLAFITGHEMVRVSCKFAKEKFLPPEEHEKHMNELRTALISATLEKRLMTCGTLKTHIPGITPNHAYAILGYDEASDIIRVWNPHGDNREVKGEPGLENGYPMSDGIFQMPLSVFVQEFAGTAYEIAPKA